MKADSYLENIFAHAVALAQNGRLRNEIYCKGRTVFVVNFDNTVILQFVLPYDILEEGQEISFEANDYDSNDFFEEDGKIVFRQSSGGFVRKKVCGKTKRVFNDVAELFQNYIYKYQQIYKNIINFHSEALSLLDESLSHIEVSAQNKEPVLIQRDVYSGSIIRLEREKKGFGFDTDNIVSDFGPIGLRTSDFMALFTFNDEIKFHMSEKSSGIVVVKGNNNDMIGVVAKCAYDEMGTITEVLTPDTPAEPKEESHGREEQKVRRRKQEADTTVDTGTQRQRRRRTEPAAQQQEEVPTEEKEPVRKRRGIQVV